MGLGGAEGEAVVDADRDRSEAARLQPGQEGGGIDRVVDVAEMEVVEISARQAVRGDHGPAWAEYPQRLREQLVLKRNRRHVVQHRERPDRVEGAVLQRHARRGTL